MRKFRVWDSKNKRMIYDDEIYKINYSHGTITITGGEEISFKDLDFMEHSGLKDYTGRNLYEKDIVRLYYVTPLGKTDTKTLDENEFEIVFNSGAYCLKDRHGGTRSIRDHMSKTTISTYISNYGYASTVNSVNLMCECVGNTIQKNRW